MYKKPKFNVESFYKIRFYSKTTHSMYVNNWRSLLLQLFKDAEIFKLSRKWFVHSLLAEIMFIADKDALWRLEKKRISQHHNIQKVKVKVNQKRKWN